MLQILYSSGGHFATKMDIKRHFEIRIVAKFSIFYGKYGQNYAFFCRDVRLRSTHFLTFLQKKSAHNFIKTRGGGGGGKGRFVKFIKKKQRSVTGERL